VSLHSIASLGTSQSIFGIESWLIGSSDGLFYNALGTVSFTTPTLFSAPGIVQQVFITAVEKKIFALTATCLYSSKDFGGTWNIVYSGLLRSMAVSQSGTIVYILLSNADLVQIQIRNPICVLERIGTMYEITDEVTRFQSFGNFLNTLLITQDIGIYHLRFRCTMGTTSSLGDCTNKNIKIGVSRTNNDFYYYSKVIPYSISFADPSTWQSFDFGFILNKFDSGQLSLTAVLLNTPIGNNTDVYLDNISLVLTFITDN
jgi:hypothetical protein